MNNNTKNLFRAVLLTIVVAATSVVCAEIWPHEPTPPVSKEDVPFARRIDPEIDRKMRSLEWRCVGPFVGVRGCGVEMHPTDKNVFYHAHSSGGVWKTEDAGQYWLPISDGQINVGAVGAIAVSRSEPDIIYIGTGEPQLRDLSLIHI